MGSWKWKCVMAVAIAWAIYVPAGDAAFTGSDHDFGGCVSCHVPHDSNVNVGFLWNRTLADSATFQLRPGATIDDGSLLCMSCHDGQTATGEASPEADKVLGTNLMDDHPIGVTYNGADSGYNISPNLPLYGVSSDQVSCGSCHDVHNTVNFGNLLRMTNTNSELCLECHAK